MARDGSVSPDWDSRYRPNPGRAVYVDDSIGPDLVKKLRPEILRLRADSLKPITLYIDSRGGGTFYARTIRELLLCADQNGDRSKLITVVTGQAASSAADLLVAGNYAIAYPNSIIHCHGNRTLDQEITQERAQRLAKVLAQTNEEFAIQYANDCFDRLIFQYCTQSANFDEIRQTEESASLSPIECFIIALHADLSPDLRDLVTDAYSQSVKSERLGEHLRSVFGTNLTSLPRPQREAMILKAILDYENSDDAQTNNSIQDGGIERLEEQMKLLLDREASYHVTTIEKQCLRWSQFFFSEEEQSKWDAASVVSEQENLLDLVKDRLTPIWFLMVSIGRFLQKDENILSAEEAYRLGLIDEVYGRDDLPCLRELLELEPDGEDSGEPELEAAAESD